MFSYRLKYVLSQVMMLLPTFHCSVIHISVSAQGFHNQPRPSLGAAEHQTVPWPETYLLAGPSVIE